MTCKLLAAWSVWEQEGRVKLVLGSLEDVLPLTMDARR
jgi:hypothetical protein